MQYGSIEPQSLAAFAASRRAPRGRRLAVVGGAIFITLVGLLALPSRRSDSRTIADVRGAPVEGSAWPSKPKPFSTMNPVDLGIQPVDRPVDSQPGGIFGDLRSGAKTRRPLPTNAWYQNMLVKNGDSQYAQQENKAYTIPYVVDTATFDVTAGVNSPTFPNGLRVHYPRLLPSDLIVQLTYDENACLQLGAKEEVKEQVASAGFLPNELALTLEWPGMVTAGSVMRSPLVRGMAYATMEYEMLTPLISFPMAVRNGPVADGGKKMPCGVLSGAQNETLNATAVRVKEYIEVDLQQSDFRWMVFLSEPTDMMCAGSSDALVLSAAAPMRGGVVRVALASNCSSGANPIFCQGAASGRDQGAFRKLLRQHAPAYPTGDASVEFTFPDRGSDREDVTLSYLWKPRYFVNRASEVEPLVYALPHHIDSLTTTAGSSNIVMRLGCLRTIHGVSCPVRGARWTMLEQLRPVSFDASQAVREDMMDALTEAVSTDIDFDVPEEYKRGAGDTYFSGKMLAKLARIILVADNIGFDSDKVAAASARLRERIDVWFNGTAETPFVYDLSWGGLVTCGCDFEDETHSCRNTYPDCPALTDAGLDFGHGFYNDHHFHHGYFIYAAAVAAKFNAEWGKRTFEHILLLIRDISNPTVADTYFHSWRHKDWFLGSSWASGIATIEGHPYPNGRNQESSSEAIAAYEAIALYGSTMAEIYGGTPWGVSDTAADPERADAARRIRDLGRLLLTTEIRSAQRYWHVTKGLHKAPYDRIYPAEYKPHVVGMLWSTMAQFQTWFGSASYLVYGIQLLPYTPISEVRDEPLWLEQLLPDFKESCESDPACEQQGWSITLYLAQAAAGMLSDAKKGIDALPDAAFSAAGGNGQSRTNSLYWIATRPLS